MPKIVELRQDRNLICTNFDGYKLSLQPVPIIRQELTSAPIKAEPNDDQYSLLHAELFSMQNLLQVDPWARTQSYFVNCANEIVRCAYDENIGRPDVQQVVYRLDDVLGEKTDSDAMVMRKKGDYNYTLRFISEKYCVVCDGIKTLILLETGDRNKALEWKLVTACKIEGTDNIKDERNYIIYDCRLDIIQEQKQISLILGHVARVESSNPEGPSIHFLYLHWCKWSLEEQLWKFVILDTLEGKGSLYYCAFEPRADSVIISSNHEFMWRSKKSVDNNQSEKAEEDEEKPHLHGATEEKEITDFTWTQTDEDLVLKFEVKPGKDKNDYDVKCLENKITIKCNDEILLDYDLFDKVDVDLTTWTIENDFLQITLIKQTSGLLWLSLLANEAGPKESSEINNDQQPIANLEAPIEDCDFPMGTTEDEITISRFNLSSKSITHTIIMGSSPPLFATSLRPGFPLALATRQDVDCCLWLQQYNPSKPEEWSVRHEGNLHAFGYVQASKQQKKFMDCSPDLGYALISESHRHVFIYKLNYDTASGLRNRSGPQVTLGKQHLIALEDAGEVLGVSTANSVAVLLTEKCVLFLQMEG